MNESQVSLTGLLKADKHLSKPIHPRGGGSNNLASCPVAWNQGFLTSFITPRLNVGDGTSGLHLVSSPLIIESLFGTPVLRLFRDGLRRLDPQEVKNCGPLSHVMAFGPGDDVRKLDTPAVLQRVLLRSHCYPGLLGWLQRTFVPEGLCSWPRPDSARPKQSLTIHWNPSDLFSIGLRKSPLSPMAKSNGKRDWDCRSGLWPKPSTGSRCVGRTRSLQRPAGYSKAYPRRCELSCRPCSDLEKVWESAARPSAIKLPRLPIIEFCPVNLSGSRLTRGRCTRDQNMCRAFLLLKYRTPARLLDI